mmetsp:Transcript_14834/g.19570  ORF Transcript_14834/g.19570 Transcript_14834/m.19570 type:complete len:216 (+) Transcript_14834:117-764(+)
MIMMNSKMIMWNSALNSFMMDLCSTFEFMAFDFETIHFSCQNDHVNPTQKFAGIILFSLGGYTPKFRIRPGYIYIKQTEASPAACPLGTAVHGHLIQELFDDNPLEIMRKGAVFGGFSIMNGALKFNSLLNRRKYNSRTMHARWKWLVQTAFKKWVQSDFKLKTVSVLDLYEPEESETSSTVSPEWAGWSDLEVSTSIDTTADSQQPQRLLYASP